MAKPAKEYRAARRNEWRRDRVYSPVTVNGLDAYGQPVTETIQVKTGRKPWASWLFDVIYTVYRPVQRRGNLYSYVGRR